MGSARQDSNFLKAQRSTTMSPNTNLFYSSSDSESFYGRHPGIDDEEFYQPSEITFDARWTTRTETLLWYNSRLSNTSIEAQAPNSQSVSFIENIESGGSSCPSMSTLHALSHSARDLIEKRMSRLYGIEPSCLATLDEQLRFSPVDSFAEVCWSEAVYEDRGSSILSLDDDSSTDEGPHNRLITPVTIRSDQLDDQDTEYLSSPANVSFIIYSYFMYLIFSYSVAVADYASSLDNTV